MGKNNLLPPPSPGANFITVTAMLGTTSVLAETPYPPPTRDGRERILRTGTCPTGYVGKGNKCETLLTPPPGGP